MGKMKIYINYIIKVALICLFLNVLLNCSSGSSLWQKKKQTSQQSFSEGVHFSNKVEKELSNGLKIVFIQDTSLPRINIMALVGSGSINDPKSKSGLAHLTASLLDEGSVKHTSSEMAEILESMGASLSILPGYDFTQVAIKGLSYTRSALLDSFLEILLTPKFEQKEVDRLKRQSISALLKMEDDPDQFSDRLISKVLFENHPYAYPTMGDSMSINKIQRSDIQDYYRSQFKASNTMIAVSGDFDEKFIQEVNTKLSAWVSDRPFKASTWDPPKEGQASSSGIWVKNKNGLVQAQIRLGHLFIDRAHPEFMNLRAANLILGGVFASRLNQKVRSELGLTYGISSSFDARRFTGPFVMETFTRNNKIGETIKASTEVYRVFAEKGITEEELESSKSILIGQFPRAVETTEALAYQLLALRFYGIEEKYLTQFITNVKSLKLSHVNEVIKKYFVPEKLNIVIYGDLKSFEDQLKPLGKINLLY